MNPLTRRGATFLAALALAAVPAGCGGDDEEPAPAPGGQGEAADGRGLFAGSCGSCHTLEAAGTSGTIGPNLDELQPDRERVLAAIAEGPGAMPENLYEGAEAEAVADFVSENAGQ